MFPLWARILIGTGIVVVLIVIFMVTYVLYHKTPVPKGCENIKLDEETCKACHNTECQFKARKRTKE